MEAEKTPSRAETISAEFRRAEASVSRVADTMERVVHAALSQAVGEDGGSKATVRGLAEEAARACLAASKETGAALWHVARGTLAGVLRAALPTELDPLEAAEVAVRVLVAEADAMGADIAAAAKGAVEGTILGAERLGFEESRSASRVATAAWAAGMELRASAGEKLRAVLTPQVSGIPTRIRER